jgi:Fic family protein
MVKIPEKAPEWFNFININFKKIIALQNNPIVMGLIEKSDQKYYYWDKIRSQPVPKELDKKEVWALIRFRRHMNSQSSPILDLKNVPFSFWITESMQKNLHYIDQSSFRNLVFCDPGLDRNASAKFVVSSLMEEAITSSQIEGAVATIKEAKKMLLEKRAPKSHSEQMIYNNYKTMDCLKTLCKKDLNISILLELHQSITHKTLKLREDEGRFRIQEDDVSIVNNDNEIIFTPPDAKEMEERLKALCAFANDDSDTPFIHPVIKAVMLHFWVGYIHPFVDGNGRVARTLFYWYLLKHDYWIFEYTSISKIILKKTTQYGYAYQYSEHDSNDLTYFIKFNIDVILESIKELQSDIQNEREKNYLASREIEQHSDLNLRQSRIVLHAYDHPKEVLTIKIHQNINGVSYQTARTDLLDLVEKGWLKSIPKGKTFYFLPSDSFFEKINQKSIS